MVGAWNDGEEFSLINNVDLHSVWDSCWPESSTSQQTSPTKTNGNQSKCTFFSLHRRRSQFAPFASTTAICRHDVSFNLLFGRVASHDDLLFRLVGNEVENKWNDLVETNRSFSIHFFDDDKHAAYSIWFEISTLNNDTQTSCQSGSFWNVAREYRENRVSTPVNIFRFKLWLVGAHIALVFIFSSVFQTVFMTKK